MAYLRETRYGLSDEEYEWVVGTGDDRDERRERLDAAVKCIVDSGTVIGHAPCRLLWDKAHKESEKTWLERLATGDADDFARVIDEIDEALKV